MCLMDEPKCASIHPSIHLSIVFQFKIPVNNQIKDLVGSCVKSIVLAPRHTQVRVQLHNYSLVMISLISFNQMIHWVRSFFVNHIAVESSSHNSTQITQCTSLTSGEAYPRPKFILVFSSSTCWSSIQTDPAMAYPPLTGSALIWKGLENIGIELKILGWN